jgi:hypothetical protein
MFEDGGGLRMMGRIRRGIWYFEEYIKIRYMAL